MDVLTCTVMPSGGRREFFHQFWKIEDIYAKPDEFNKAALRLVGDVTHDSTIMNIKTKYTHVDCTTNLTKDSLVIRRMGGVVQRGNFTARRSIQSYK